MATLGEDFVKNKEKREEEEDDEVREGEIRETTFRDFALTSES